jgi:hypothetical protein
MMYALYEKCKKKLIHTNNRLENFNAIKMAVLWVVAPWETQVIFNTIIIIYKNYWSMKEYS